MFGPRKKTTGGNIQIGQGSLRRTLQKEPTKFECIVTIRSAGAGMRGGDGIESERLFPFASMGRMKRGADPALDRPPLPLRA